MKEYKKRKEITKKPVKRKLFREEYLSNGFNATRAYMKVFKEKDNRSAAVEAHKLLKKPNMMERIDKRINEMLYKLDIKNEAILAEQAKLAFIDARTFFDEDGVFVGIHNLNVAQQSCIESVEYEEVYTGKGESKINTGRKVKVKLYSRQKAIDSLMKYKGLIKQPENRNTFINFDSSNKTIIAAKELKETLGVDGTIELNKLLEANAS
jgi:hypothetical protein